MALRTVGRVLRNHLLVRVAIAYACFSLSEYAVWIGVLVYAYGNGGATEAGLVALAQLAPSILIAPLLATLTDRHAPARLMAAAYAAQAVAIGLLAIAVLASTPPMAAYAAAVVASTAMSAIRPAQATLVPALTRDVEELTATNVLVGWLESLSMVVAGLVTGLALSFGSVAAVFAGAALLLAGAAVLVAPLRVRAPGGDGGHANAFRHVAQGIGQVAGNRPTRLLVGLLGAEYVLIGALDVLFVVVAIELLHRGPAWTGYLNTAYGAGGVVLGSLAAFLVGRRLGPVIVSASLMTGLALAATVFLRGPVAVAVLLAVVGGGRALFDVATRALLQRAVPAEMVARAFGLAEGLSTAGLAVGSLLTPVLVAIGGGRLALAGVAAILPTLACLPARLVLRLDAHAQVPIVEISLMRTVPLFQDLPGPALEGVARALERRDIPAGEHLIKQGDVGTGYYAIADGSLEVWRDGQRIRVLGRGAGVGEIALLRSEPRTASVVSTTPVTVYALDRDSFLTAVNGHVPTPITATGIARELGAGDERRSPPAAPDLPTGQT